MKLLTASAIKSFFTTLHKILALRKNSKSTNICNMDRGKCAISSLYNKISAHSPRMWVHSTICLCVHYSVLIRSTVCRGNTLPETAQVWSTALAQQNQAQTVTQVSHGNAHHCRGLILLSGYFRLGRLF